MKIFKKNNVYDEALIRIRYLFDEFENIVVAFSGGKDSTVILNLALKIAEEKNRLPLKVLFIDQEAEWQGTIDYVTKIMTDSRVEPLWFQMPMVITNNASSYNRYNYCWNEDEKDKWIHNKHEISIKINKYGTNRFHDLFNKILLTEFTNLKSCYLAGVRAEEAPKRLAGLTNALSYKDITWGKVINKETHYTFYPIYDWSYTDIWIYIHKNNLEYNKVYDELYRHGVVINDMRISNLHHETAIQSLLLVQEIEPETWNKITDRIDGASSIKHIKKNSFTCPEEFPYMFKDWEEYGLHLLNNLIQDEKNKKILLEKIKSKKNIYNGEKVIKQFWRTIINTILSSDWDYTKLANFECRPHIFNYRNYKIGNYKKDILLDTKAFTKNELIDLKQKLNARN
jgi:predicted phosphoadenosine phosphosulfate sulfurtransferase